MFFSANEILAWRKAQLNLGGRAADIDWLIDIITSIRSTIES